MRTLARSFALALAAALLVGCGSERTDDPGAAPDPVSSPTSGTPSPTAGAGAGGYPSFAPEDYTYTLSVSCFCPDVDSGLRITVEDGEVRDAVYAGSGRGHHGGGTVPAFRRLTINDVIDAANNTGAARVEVTWPRGQDYPSGVYVDVSKRMIDEEIGYRISDVVVD